MKAKISYSNDHILPPSVARSVFTAQKIINEDISRHLVLKELANHAGTNECTLKKGFKNIFRITIYRYLLAARMKNANDLLQNTDIKEKDIAVVCGYESLSSFITSYRKYFGISPGEFRRRSIIKLRI